MPGCWGWGFGGAVLLAHLLKMLFGRPRTSLSPVLVPMPTDFSLYETNFSEPGNPATILYGKSTSDRQGSASAARYDFSFAHKMVLSVFIQAGCFILRQWIDFFFILTATALILMAELFNSAVETLCDFVEKHENQKLKVIKGISAVAVGIGIVLWGTITVVEIVRLWRLFRQI
jgi:diacylglycerol kinase (ATP)